jgi:hypothetical protein
MNAMLKSFESLEVNANDVLTQQKKHFELT